LDCFELARERLVEDQWMHWWQVQLGGPDHLLALGWSRNDQWLLLPN